MPLLLLSRALILSLRRIGYWFILLAWWLATRNPSLVGESHGGQTTGGSTSAVYSVAFLALPLATGLGLSTLLQHADILRRERLPTQAFSITACGAMFLLVFLALRVTTALESPACDEVSLHAGIPLLFEFVALVLWATVVLNWRELLK